MDTLNWRESQPTEGAAGENRPCGLSAEFRGLGITDLVSAEADMEERGLVQTDFARLVGSRSLASAILNRKRPMSLSVIRKLAAAWDIPADILVQPYRLEGQRSAKAA